MAGRADRALEREVGQRGGDMGEEADTEVAVLSGGSVRGTGAKGMHS